MTLVGGMLRQTHLVAINKRGVSTALIATGVGLACAALLSRKFIYLYRDMKRLSAWTGKSGAVFYHQGGFLPKMDKKEAAMILNVRESSTKDAIKDAHRKVMIANHPDRGGSPYIATKINEAKSILERRGD